MKVKYYFFVLVGLMIMFALPAVVNAARPSLAGIQAQIDALKDQVNSIQGDMDYINQEDGNNIKISSLELIVEYQPLTYSGQLEAECPSDKFIISGGARSDNFGYFLSMSYPDNCTNNRCSKWVAHASPRDEYNVPSYGVLYVYALCSN